MFARPKPALTALGSLDNVGSSAARCRIERHKPVSKKKHRMSPEQLRLMSRRIDPTQPLSSPHTAPLKPALPVLYSPSLPTSKKRKRAGVCCATTATSPPPPPPPSPLLSRQMVYTPPSSPQLSSTSSNNCSSSGKNNIGKTISRSSDGITNGLFQTCFDIWPGAPSLGDMTHENVKCLSELLKVRLSQAKYRLMAALEVDKTDPLYLQLKSGEDDEGWPLQTRKPEKIQLSAKRHHTFAVTVGSGRRLFKDRMPLRSSPASSSQPSTPSQQVKLVTDISGKLSVVAVTTPVQEHRKRPTKKRKTSTAAAGTAADVSVNSRSVTQRQQGSRPFYCKHCNKRYKNRSGLTYHLGRCKYRSPPGKENIQCICGNVSQKDQTLVCCHACQSWLHRSCVGWKDNAIDKEYTCPRCPVPPQTAAVEQQQQQLQNLPIIDGGDQQQHLLWSAAMLEGYGSPWSMPDIPSVLFSDPLSMPDEDYGLMTPTSNVSLSDTPTPQQDSCWFDFADFDNDFTCD